MTKPISKRNKAKLYRATAKSFESGEFSWTTGRMGQVEGVVHCAIGGLHHTAIKMGLETSVTYGAIRMGQARNAAWRDADVERAVYEKLTGKSTEAIAGAGYDQPTDIMWALQFNDGVAAGVEDVVRFLKRCASALEHGGRV